MIRIQRLGLFLEAHFGEVEYHMPDEESETEEEELTSHGEPSFLIQLDDADARINLLSMVRPSLFISYLFPRLCQNPQTVDSSSEALRRRVEAVLEMAVSTVSSLSESFESGAPEEFSSGRIHKPKVDVSPSDVAEGGAAQTVVDQNESSSPEVETQRPHD
jgi:cleavage and polyadenylation specificity factor subunit 3